MRGYLTSMATACKKERERIELELKRKIALLEEKHLKFGGKKTLRKLNLARKKIELADTANIQKDLLFLRQNFVTKSPKYLKWLNWKARKRIAAKYITSLNSKHSLPITANCVQENSNV